MKTLLAQGADVNLASDRGQTPLMLAAVFGYEEIARLLLAAGASVGLKDTLGLTARDWAERRGFQTIRLLIEQAKSAANGKAAVPTGAASSNTNGDYRIQEPHHFNEDVKQTAGRPSGLIAVLRARAAEASKEAELATEVPSKSVTSPLPIEPQINAQPVTPPIAAEPVKLAPKPPAPPAPRPSIAPRATGPLNIGAAQAEVLTPSTSHSSAKIMLWGLVIATFLGASFLTYRLMSRPSTPAPAAAPAVVKTETPKTAPVKPTPVVAGDVAGAELTIPEPQLPVATASKVTRDNSVVTVRVQVNRKGKVISARVTRGDALLRSAATAAAKQATFAADKLPAKPKVVTGTITYTLPVMEATAISKVTTESDTGRPSVSQELAGAQLSIPNADYPGGAKSKRLEGTITVTVRVGRTGKVISWRTSSGDYQLRMAALNAAKKATFSPEKLPGKGEVVGTITYTFKG